VKTYLAEKDFLEVFGSFIQNSSRVLLS